MCKDKIEYLILKLGIAYGTLTMPQIGIAYCPAVKARKTGGPEARKRFNRKRGKGKYG